MKSTDYDGFSAFVEFFEKVLMERERPANFFIDMDYFGTQCAININDCLKKKWHSPDATHSLISLFKLIQEELLDSSDRFSSGQFNFIRKRVAHFAMSEPKDIQAFLTKLTFTDNNGSVKGLDNYTVGDENEFEENDDSAYGGMELHDAVLQQLNEPEPDRHPNDACVVCLINEKAIMLAPCNHLKFCRDYVDRLMMPQFDSNGVAVVPTCPVCRQVI